MAPGDGGDGGDGEGIDSIGVMGLERRRGFPWKSPIYPGAVDNGYRDYYL